MNRIDSMQIKKHSGRRCLWTRWATSLIGLLLIVAISDAADVAPNKLSIESVRVGFDGKFKVGHWTPIWIDFSGVSEPLVGTLSLSMPDGEGQLARYRYDDVELTPEATTSLCYVKFGRVRSSVQIAFTPGESESGQPVEFTANELPAAIPTSERFVVTLGASVGVEESLVMRSRRTNESIESRVVASLSKLPDQWIGYAGVDVLVVPTRHGMWRNPGGQQRLSAITKWVRFGGTIVLSCGEYADQLLAEGAALREVLPGTFDRVGEERETKAIEEFVGGDGQLNISESDGADLHYARLTDTKGTVLFSEGSGAARHPAAVVGMAGLGKVVFAAFDLDSDTLSKWPNRPELMRRLLEQALGPVERDENTQVGMTQYGYDDIVGQLRMSMNSFAGVRVVPFSIVALLIATYVMFIGPIDYFFHHRISQKFELTWITFPLLVAAFCALAYALAAGQGRAAMQLNRVGVVDVDSETHNALGSSWWYVYSPTNQQLDLSIDADTDSLSKLDDSLTMWDGLAGAGFGGMNGGITSRQTAAAYDIVAEGTSDGFVSRLAGIPIDVRSSRGLYSQWTGTFNSEANRSALQIGIENQIEGDVVNSLPFTLDRCWLVYDRWVYQIGSLRTGQQKSLLGMTSRDLRSLLTQQEFVESRYKTTPWDRDSTVTDDIVRMMLLFSAVRGEAYTGLRHRYQDHIDCGLNLKSGRAMLIGESASAPIKMTSSGQELKASRGVTYFRLSIPVETKR